MPIRLVLAEDNYLLREGMSRLIEAQPGLELVEACGDLDSLLEAIDTHRPDVVLTDIRMPPTGTNEGIRAAEHVRHQADDLPADAATSGAVAYVNKEEFGPQVLEDVWAQRLDGRLAM